VARVQQLLAHERDRNFLYAQGNLTGIAYAEV
jgi:hypothetical protein